MGLGQMKPFKVMAIRLMTCIHRREAKVLVGGTAEAIPYSNFYNALGAFSLFASFLETTLHRI